MRFFAKAALFAIFAATASAAMAGPPFDTDDPEPTDTGHWEIYNFAAGDHDQGAWNGSAGLDLNYGAAPGVQLTATLPIDFERDGAFHAGAGDVELAIKYRFIHREKQGFSVAIFPRAFVPTAGHRFGSGRLSMLLPIWAQKDFGPWSLFGGGGYTINPGAGNRDFWTGGAAITRQIGKTWLLGGEITRMGADTIGGRATTTLGGGGIHKLGGPFAFLFSGGPEWQDGRARAGFHFYAALGLDF